MKARRGRHYYYAESRSATIAGSRYVYYKFSNIRVSFAVYSVDIHTSLTKEVAHCLHRLSAIKLCRDRSYRYKHVSQCCMDHTVQSV